MQDCFDPMRWQGVGVLVRALGVQDQRAVAQWMGHIGRCATDVPAIAAVYLALARAIEEGIPR